MKQVLLRGGKVVIEEVPAPHPTFGQVLVRVAWSCVSPGTELVSAAATHPKNIIDRFRSNPAMARKAYKLLRDRGVRRFGAMAQDRLTASRVVGYSCAGEVVEVMPGVEGIAVGDHVACAGSGFANHAEGVAIPANLIVKAPSDVDLADAATVTLGAIALQGVRRSQAALGERIGVIGLGFIGQLTAQLLRAAGCRVFGVDLDPNRIAQAQALGIDLAVDNTEAIDRARQFSDGYGLDAVLLTAATSSDEPLALAMQMTRRKGRVVVVGDVGLGVRRRLMYEKELDLVMSTSYGPGRYDPSYEEDGLDYPFAYVRWTENRNMQAYLECIASGQVTLPPLTSVRMPVAEAAEGFRLLQEGQPRPYTVLLQYPASTTEPLARNVSVNGSGPTRNGVVSVAVLGAGAFARSVHVPNLQKLNSQFSIDALVTRHGPVAVAEARKAGARLASTDYRQTLQDDQTQAVLIATRHYLHAEMVTEALQAHKHVFVEKPLALAEAELEALEQVVAACHASPMGCPVVFVGFNRRYAPCMTHLKQVLAPRDVPLHIMYRMNAGYQPPNHWVHGMEGGGRVLGEACHIFDLFRFLTGAPAVDVWATGLQTPQSDILSSDNFTATIRYADGSIATLLYTGQGGADLPKEAMELHVGQQSFLLDDYKTLRGFGIKNADFRTKQQEKGHLEELRAFHDAIRGALDRRMLWEEAVEVTRTTLEVGRQVNQQSRLEDLTNASSHERL